MLTPGTILQNRYRIVSLLGQGGMGAVYRAWDLRLNVAVAVKEMVRQPGIDAQTLAGLRQQFYQEAQVLARLSHPNLVRVTDYFEEGGNAYLVMDFVEGQSLADLIARQGPLPEAQVLEWARQLLDALAYCHRQGVIHRDIKPQNIIITPSPVTGEGWGGGRAVLVDFGLVKLWDPRDPRTRTVVRAMGTPEYAPPEQWGSGHTDPRSDLYSLGATLYHALTGQVPPGVTERIAHPERLIPLRNLNALVSRDTEAAVMRAMELAATNRFANAAAMRAALIRQAVTEALPQRLWKGWPWIVTGLVAIALVGLIGWGMWQQQRQQEQAAALRATAYALANTATAQTAIQATATAQMQATATAQARTTATVQAYLRRPLISAGNATQIQHLQIIEAHSGWISGVAFSPDGSLLASSAWDYTVQVWRVQYGEIIENPIFILQHDSQVDDVTFSPDGKILASSGCSMPFEAPCKQGIINFYAINDGKLIRTIEAHSSVVSDIAFSSDGQTLASSSDDHTVRLWRVSDGSLLRTLEGHTNIVTSITFSPDGQNLASGSWDGTVRLWRVSDGKLVRRWQEHTVTVSKLAFSPNGHLVAAVGGDDDPILVVWNVENGEVVYKRSDHRLSAGSVVFSLDGSLIITGGGHEDHVIQVRQASNGRPIAALYGHDAWVADLAISPDGRLLVSGGGDGRIIVWGIP